LAVSDDAKPTQGAARAQQVQTIFSEIAPRYDLLNHVLSGGIDKGWRRKAIRELNWERDPSGTFLDACAGTFDLSLALAKQAGFSGTLVGSDFAYPMLSQGLKKIRGTKVTPVCADSQVLPFPDEVFSGATVGFGVRNLSNLDMGFREFHRTLKLGSKLVVLEFTVPPNPVVRWGYMVYFNYILPRIGRLVSGHPWAYTYLPESVKEFPGPEALADLMKNAGFSTVSWSLVTGGIAAIHVAEK